MWCQECDTGLREELVKVGTCPYLNPFWNGSELLLSEKAERFLFHVGLLHLLVHVTDLFCYTYGASL